MNGSFEDAPPVLTYFNIAAGASSLAGWQVTGEGIDVVSDAYWQASHGMRSVDRDVTSRGGVPAERISTRGYGQSQPAATNDIPEGRQKNRRVEIRIQKQ